MLTDVLHGNKFERIAHNIFSPVEGNEDFCIWANAHKFGKLFPVKFKKYDRNDYIYMLRDPSRTKSFGKGTAIARDGYYSQIRGFSQPN